MRFVEELTKGFWKEIPPFRLVLGICPALAVSDQCEKAIGMGLAVTFVLVCSNVMISALRKIIPPKVRIAFYIVVVATFVVIVEMVTHAYVFSLYQKLGIFIPLIVVNCIPLGRAEAFAGKEGVALSFADGLGLGLGYTIALFALAAIRETLAAGSIYGVPYIYNMFEHFKPFLFAKEAPGAFVFLGSMLGLMNLTSKK
jgi:electron transport complex protein RnfE